jgi:hypothetical protein
VADARLRALERGDGGLAGRLGPAERALAEVLAELRAAGEAVRRAGGEPTEVLHAVEGGAEFFTGFLAMRVCYVLGQVQRARGNLGAAAATYRHALDAAGENSQRVHTGMAHVGLAQVLYERKELDAALDHASRGITLCRQLGYTRRWPQAWLSWPGFGTRRVTRPGPGRRWAQPDRWS